MLFFFRTATKKIKNDKMAAQLNNFLMGFSISDIFHQSLNQCSLRLNKQYHQFYCNKSKLINKINAMTIEIINVINA